MAEYMAMILQTFSSSLCQHHQFGRVLMGDHLLNSRDNKQLSHFFLASIVILMMNNELVVQRLINIFK